jgi:murein DD-endopeptidase MepM/ murein hydrolase activator NlpD
MGRGHRQVLFALDGEVRIPARFAIDWVKVDANGRFALGDGSRVADWHGYDAEVLAVSDAVVAAVRDTIAEAPAVALVAHGLDKASGNYVTLDLGAGRYASYEHLKPGSILVRPGDRVRAGQVIARVGTTGDSMGPHLHFHVSDGSTPLAGEGLPFVIRSFDVVGAYASIAVVGKEPWTPVQADKPGARHMEMPAANTVIRFVGGAPERER